MALWTSVLASLGVAVLYVGLVMFCAWALIKAWGDEDEE